MMVVRHTPVAAVTVLNPTGFEVGFVVVVDTVQWQLRTEVRCQIKSKLISEGEIKHVMGDKT